jgi:hypothetical protein
MKKFILSYIAIFFIFVAGYQSEILSEISKSFGEGNATQIAQYFNKSIELTLFDKEDIYSNTQAEMILRDFFAKHKPTQFKIIHQGGKEDSKYAIGRLTGNSESYRVTILIKTENNNSFIHQLRIENDRVE